MHRKITNHVARDCEKYVRLSLYKVTLQVAKNTARKARSYMLAYMSDAGNSHLLIENFVKIHKCHRNILDQEGAYLDKQLKVIAGHVEIVKEERSSLLAEKAEGKMEEEVEREPTYRQPDVELDAETMSDFFRT